MSRSSLFIVGECGTGKTLMAAVAAHAALQGNYRALVVGPPHLTRPGSNGSKWAREILSTLPGVEVIHLDDHRKVLALPRLLQERTKPVWVLASRNFLKLGPPWKASCVLTRRQVTTRDKKKPWIWNKDWVPVALCPHCGAQCKDADDVPRSPEYLAAAQRKCRTCGSPLWSYAWPEVRGSKGVPVVQYNSSRPLFLPATWLSRRVRFDLGIFDEAHELKGGGTAQGQMLGTLASRCDRVLALTGTLFGGKASDLYYLMWRLCPDRMIALGLEYRSSLNDFVGRYGIRQRVIDPDDAVRGSRSRRRDNAQVVEKPGICPTLFTDLLLDKAVFLSLDELAEHLPPGVLPPRPHIEVDLCDLGPLEDPYRRMHNTIQAQLRQSGGRRGGMPSMGLISAFFNGCDCWPDHPFGFGPITTKIVNENGVVQTKLVYTPMNMPDGLYPKDQRLIEIVKGEAERGRRCIVYTVHTIKHPVGERIADMLERAGLRVAVLGAGVPTEKRETWLARKRDEGAQVLVTHPGKVETGLDLIDWPTIIFHSMGTRPFTFRQAGARAWRIGQSQRCRVIILAYKGTMQEMIASLMFAKMKAATRLEGQILEDLASIGEGEDIQDQILRAVQEGQKLAFDTQDVSPVLEKAVPTRCVPPRARQAASWASSSEPIPDAGSILRRLSETMDDTVAALAGLCQMAVA